jgi:hypothetical protein
MDTDTTSTDNLITRLGQELERGAIGYRQHETHASFVFADSDYGDYGIVGNALIVSLTAITPGVSEWISSHCIALPSTVMKRTSLLPEDIPNGR